MFECGEVGFGVVFGEMVMFVDLVCMVLVVVFEDCVVCMIICEMFEVEVGGMKFWFVILVCMLVQCLWNCEEDEVWGKVGIL